MVAQRLAVDPEQDKAEQAKVLPEEADRVLESSDLMAHPMTCDKLAPETATSAEALAREAAVAVADGGVRVGEGQPFEPENFFACMSAEGMAMSVSR